MMQIEMFLKDFVKPESIQSRLVCDTFPNDIMQLHGYTQNCYFTFVVLSHQENQSINVKAFMHHAIYECIVVYV